MTTGQKKVVCRSNADGPLCFFDIDVFRSATRDCSKPEAITANKTRVRTTTCTGKSAAMEFQANFLNDPRTARLNGRLVKLSGILPGSANMTDEQVVSLETSLISAFGPRIDEGDGVVIAPLFCKDGGMSCEQGTVVLTPKTPIAANIGYRELRYFNDDVLLDAAAQVEAAQHQAANP
jgi:hypothetical protein